MKALAADMGGVPEDTTLDPDPPESDAADPPPERPAKRKLSMAILQSQIDEINETLTDFRQRIDANRIDLSRAKNPGLDIGKKPKIQAPGRPVTLNVLGEQVTRYI